MSQRCNGNHSHFDSNNAIPVTSIAVTSMSSQYPHCCRHDIHVAIWSYETELELRDGAGATRRSWSYETELELRDGAGATRRSWSYETELELRDGAGATRRSWSWRNELELEARAVAGAAECHRLLQRCNGKHSHFDSNNAIPVTSIAVTSMSIVVTVSTLRSP